MLAARSWGLGNGELVWEDGKVLEMWGDGDVSTTMECT